MTHSTWHMAQCTWHRASCCKTRSEELTHFILALLLINIVTYIYSSPFHSLALCHVYMYSDGPTYPKSIPYFSSQGTSPVESSVFWSQWI